MNIAYKIIGPLFKEFTRQIVIELKEEFNKGLAIVKEETIKKYSGLDNEVLSKNIIIILQSSLDNTWNKVYEKNKGKGFFKDLVLNGVAYVVKEKIDGLHEYQPQLQSFLSKQVNKNKISKTIDWIDIQVDNIINKVFPQ